MTGTSVSRTNLSRIDVTCDVDNMYPDTTGAEGGTVRKLTGKAIRVCLSTTQGDRFADEGPGFGRERAFGFSSSYYTASNARKRLG